jgi:hypothetical protein
MGFMAQRYEDFNRIRSREGVIGTFARYFRSPALSVRGWIIGFYVS